MWACLCFLPGIRLSLQGVVQVEEADGFDGIPHSIVRGVLSVPPQQHFGQVVLAVHAGGFEFWVPYPVQARQVHKRLHATTLSFSYAPLLIMRIQCCGNLIRRFCELQCSAISRLVLHPQQATPCNPITHPIKLGTYSDMSRLGMNFQWQQCCHAEIS